MSNVLSLLTEGKPQYPAEVKALIDKLRSSRFGLDFSGENIVTLDFGNEGDESGETEEEVGVQVYPSRRWMKAVSAQDKAWLHAHYEGRYSDQAALFEQTMQEADFELGSTGGGNFDYNKSVEGKTYTFAFWGNPWHV